MPRISMKLTASVIGSLALLLAAACDRRTENTSQPAPGTTGTAPQEPNSMQTTPGTAGGAATPGNTTTPNNRPSAAAPAENPDTVPVRGTEPEMQGAGGASASGHGGHGGQAGHGAQSNR
jgi:hypothetical protein